MRADAWFCLDCNAVRDLDIHARCECCGSDSVTLAGGRQLPVAARQPAPMTLVMRADTRVQLREVFRQPILLTAGRPAATGTSAVIPKSGTREEIEQPSTEVRVRPRKPLFASLRLGCRRGTAGTAA